MGASGNIPPRAHSEKPHEMALEWVSGAGFVCVLHPPFFALSPILRVLGSVSGLKPPKTCPNKPTNFDFFPLLPPPFTDGVL